MIKRFLTVSVGVAVLLTLVLAGCAPSTEPTTPTTPTTPTSPTAPTTPTTPSQPASQTFKYRMQSSHGPALVTYQLLEKRLEEIKLISGGRLQIELYQAGALIPAFEVFQEVGKGTLDAFHSFPGYWGGIDEGLPPFCNYPGGLNGEDYMTWLYQAGGLELIRSAYGENNLYLVDMWGHGQEQINSTIPMRGVADVNGTKGRIGGKFVDVVNAMGATTIMVATPEAYTSLQTRVIDWADAGDIPSNFEMGLHEVCPYTIFPGWHQTTSMATITFNQQKWDALPPDLQALMHVSVRALAEELRELEDYQSALTLAKMEELGVEIITWSPEQIAQVNAIIKNLEDTKWKSQSELSSQVIESMNSFWDEFAGYKYSVLTKRA